MSALTDEAREEAIQPLLDAIHEPEKITKQIMNWPPPLGRAIEQVEHWQARAAIDAIAPILLAAGAADMQERIAAWMEDRAIGGAYPEFDTEYEIAAAIRALPTTPEEGK